MINLGQANRQAESIRGYASNLKGLKNTLDSFKYNLNTAWEGMEMQHINNFLDTFSSNLNNLCINLDNLADDLVETAEEIWEEDEAKLVAEMNKELKL